MRVLRRNVCADIRIRRHQLQLLTHDLTGMFKRIPDRLTTRRGHAQCFAGSTIEDAPRGCGPVRFTHTSPARIPKTMAPTTTRTVSLEVMLSSIDWLTIVSQFTTKSPAWDGAEL